MVKKASNQTVSLTHELEVIKRSNTRLLINTLLTKCQFCHKDKSSCIRNGLNDSRNGPYCDKCALHYNLAQILYTASHHNIQNQESELKDNNYNVNFSINPLR